MLRLQYCMRNLQRNDDSCRKPMSASDNRSHFETTVLIHLDAAFNLARWLIDDEAAAEDAVQDACIRAQRFFASLSGPNAKAWFMAIVRNTCLDILRERKVRRIEDEYQEETHGQLFEADRETPEQAASRASEARWVRAAIDALPIEFREVIVLRELEDMSYKEISAIVKVPMGTVMSRLARGRDLLAQRLRADVRRVES